MKQTQKQNVIININNEVKTKRKRRYTRKNNNVMEQQNPQTTAYNPNVLVKNNTTPSYGLKSVNPAISSDTSMLSTLLLDKLKSEPTKEQYVERMTPIKQEPITPIRPMRPLIKEEEITPKTPNIKQETITPIRPMRPLIKEEEITPAPPTNNINQFRVNPNLQKPNFSIYQSPIRTTENVKVEPAFSVGKGEIKNVIRGLVSSSNDTQKDILPQAPKKVQNINVFPIEKPQTTEKSSMFPATLFFKKLLTSPPKETQRVAPAKTNEISDIKLSDLYQAPEVEGYLDFLPKNLAKTQKNEISTQTYTRAVGKPPQYRTLKKLEARIKELKDVPISKRSDKEKEDLFSLELRLKSHDYDL